MCVYPMPPRRAMTAATPQGDRLPRVRTVTAVLGLALMAGCGEATPAADAGTDAGMDAAGAVDAGPRACGVCATWGSNTRAETVTDDALREVSGIAESRRRPGWYWVHNDSGDAARVFAVDSAGRTRLELALEGARAVDWEDLAVGPCGTSTCVFVGDIGDNNRRRSDCAVLRFDESVLDTVGDNPDVRAMQTIRPETMPVRYPDGARDAEALVVDPATGRFVVISKEPEGATAGVYAQPETAGTDGVWGLVRVGGMDVPAPGSTLVTAADWHPCAPRLLVRTYDRVLEYAGPPGASLAMVIAATPTVLPAARETQGEAVAWALDGHSFVTLSEGRAQSFRVTRCADATGGR